MFIYMVPIFIIKAGHMNMRKKINLKYSFRDMNDGVWGGGGKWKRGGLKTLYTAVKHPWIFHLYM